MATHVTVVENESTHMTTSRTFGELLLSCDRSHDRRVKNESTHMTTWKIIGEWV